MNVHQNFLVEDHVDGRTLRRGMELPHDFAEHARNGSNADLYARYGVGAKVLARWRKEANVPAPMLMGRNSMVRALPPPEDFKDHSRKTNEQIASHYGVGLKTISRWRKETGAYAPQSSSGFAAKLPRTFVPAPVSGEASEACQFLRSTHRPVYHRIIEGKQYKGTYVVGRQIMSEQELLAFAQQKGFQAISEIFY